MDAIIWTIFLCIYRTAIMKCSTCYCAMKEVNVFLLASLLVGFIYNFLYTNEQRLFF